MLRKKVFLYVSFVKSVQFVCAIISVFYNFYKKMDLFVKIVGLCRPTYVFFITFVNGILETEYRNYANFAFI